MEEVSWCGAAIVATEVLRIHCRRWHRVLHWIGRMQRIQLDVQAEA
jgi:hypothetical protein